MKKIKAKEKYKKKKNKSNLFTLITNYRPFTNIGIKEDAEEPKEPAHYDYKYITSYEGPLTKPSPKKI